MKTSASNINENTQAQIKPQKNTGTLVQNILKHIWLSQTIIIIFFLATSYVNEENAMYDLRNEFYHAEMHEAIFSSLQLSGTIQSELKAPALVDRLYYENRYNALWTLNQYPGSSAKELMEMLKNASFYGLDKNLYGYDQLVLLMNGMQNTSRTDSLLNYRKQFELMLTDACLLFAVHLNNGLISTDTLDPEKQAGIFTDHIYAGIRHNDLATRLLSLQPQNLQYANLQKALEKFVKNNEINDLTIEIPDEKTDSTTSINKTKQVLVHLGYITEQTAANDSLFKVALMEFQKHHGIHADGRLNRDTRKALSMSTRERFLRAALTLDKLRKDNEYGDHYIYVNIPSFQLKLFRDKKLNKTFNVVVGRPSTPTPELSSRVETIVTAPEWNVPKTITMNELLPRVKKDSTYLVRNNFKLIDKQLNPVDIHTVSWKDVDTENFNYYFIQNSGSSNALGLVKFSFRNPYRVYIHDTPSKKYFNHDTRAYSHGCIRLQHPDQLASYLVDNNLQSNQKPDIAKLIEKRINQDIALTEPIDIHIRYLTCEADDELNLYFYKDIYNKDSKLIHSLFN
ncbi:MAG: L,D-transpeptidase family protein [Bacteroidales bacterium]|nr:L,D-transpeptidase family protein [Bacteroidales bacterium]